VEHLWAPWRMSYVGGSQDEGCVFCTQPALADDDAGLILHRGELVFIMLNQFPYNTGHLLLAPFRHLADPLAMSPQESSELLYGMRISVEVLRAVYHPEGFNIGANIGACAGAGYASHVHVHVVPRWPGDTNYMAVTAATRIVPESLTDTYERLREALAARGQLASGG